jgi:hypothetical protein
MSQSRDSWVGKELALRAIFAYHRIKEQHMQTMKSAPMRDSQINSQVSVPARKIPAQPSEPVVGKPAGSRIPGFSGGIKPGKIK